MYAKQLIKRMASEERNLVRDGAIYTFMATGAFSYFHYREYMKKCWKRSEAHYRFKNQTIINCTPWKQMYFSWWRMPEEEWTVYHRFRPYFIIGQLDYSKEVLIPRNKTVNGVEIPGYDVINPFYCYEGGKISFEKNMNRSGDPISIDRAALIVKRGWIPAEFKEKSSRPGEVNSRELIKLTGCFMPGKNVHDYTVPNDPDANEWNNLCLEDIGMYWDLPNFDESKYYYFQTVDLHGQNFTQRPVTPVMADSVDEIVNDFYRWKWNETSHKNIAMPFGAISAASLAIAFLSL